MRMAERNNSGESILNQEQNRDGRKAMQQVLGDFQSALVTDCITEDHHGWKVLFQVFDCLSGFPNNVNRVPRRLKNALEEIGYLLIGNDYENSLVFLRCAHRSLSALFTQIPDGC